MLVIGDEIIETPMAWPCRYFETHSYRPILKDYFRRGARWTAAPRPQLTDELFDPKFRLPEKGEAITYILTEFEPVFDAADFFRCGREFSSPAATSPTRGNRLAAPPSRRRLSHP